MSFNAQKVKQIDILNYFSVVKRNKLLVHAVTWMDLKAIMLHEKSLQRLQTGFHLNSILAGTDL